MGYGFQGQGQVDALQGAHEAEQMAELEGAV